MEKCRYVVDQLTNAQKPTHICGISAEVGHSTYNFHPQSASTLRYDVQTQLPPCLFSLQLKVMYRHPALHRISKYQPRAWHLANDPCTQHACSAHLLDSYAAWYDSQNAKFPSGSYHSIGSIWMRSWERLKRASSQHTLLRYHSPSKQVC